MKEPSIKEMLDSIKQHGEKLYVENQRLRKQQRTVTREWVNGYAEKIVNEVFNRDYVFDNSQTLLIITALLQELGVEVVDSAGEKK